MLDSQEYRQRYKLFRDRLRAARQLAGLSQAEAASRLRKPQSYVSKCESGERRVDFVELLVFARLYGIDDVRFFDKDTAE